LEVALRWSSDVKRRQFSSLACSMVSLYICLMGVRAVKVHWESHRHLVVN